MWCRGLFAGVLPLLLLGALGCSKTEDKAAEKRLFGDPPKFTAPPKVEPRAGAATVPCDVTDAAIEWANHEFGDSFTLSNTPIMVNMSYTEVTMTVQVSDPQDVEGKTDILGVFARYVPDTNVDSKSPKYEDVLVLLDDGQHDCSKINPNTHFPAPGCFPSNSIAGVHFQGECTYAPHEEPKIVCEYPEDHAGCKDKQECVDGFCHRAQECQPQTWRCLCGSTNCDDLATWSECLGVERMDLGGACTGPNIKCYRPDATDPMRVQIDPAGYAICDNRFQGEPDLTSCLPEEQVCDDAVVVTSRPTCTYVPIFVTAGDTQAGDGTYSRTFALANLATAGVGADLAKDCVVSQVHQTPILLPSADPVEFSIEVVDKSANDTVWPEKFPVKPVKAEFICTGNPTADACLCCLLEKGKDGRPYNPDGGGGCFGAPGLIGVKYTAGYCKTCIGNADPVACCIECDPGPQEYDSEGKPLPAPTPCPISKDDPGCETKKM